MPELPTGQEVITFRMSLNRCYLYECTDCNGVERLTVREELHYEINKVVNGV